MGLVDGLSLCLQVCCNRAPDGGQIVAEQVALTGDPVGYGLQQAWQHFFLPHVY